VHKLVLHAVQRRGRFGAGGARPGWTPWRSASRKILSAPPSASRQSTLGVAQSVADYLSMMAQRPAPAAPAPALAGGEAAADLPLGLALAQLAGVYILGAERQRARHRRHARGARSASSTKN